MSFITDIQTINDLNIFEKRGTFSVYEMFNHTSTRGGSQVLMSMFKTPMSDVGKIRQRANIILLFQKLNKVFPVNNSLFDIAEQYLANKDERTQLSYEEGKWAHRFKSAIGTDSEYQLISKGQLAILDILFSLNGFIKEIKLHAIGTSYELDILEMEQLLYRGGLYEAIEGQFVSKISYEKAIYFDKILRFKYSNDIEKLFHLLYRLDVYLTVAKIASEISFSFPEVLDKENDTIVFEGIYHPAVKSAVPNSIEITAEYNTIFLTGANMAGKSTLMKSISIAIYLAHMGFPVPARVLKLSVRDGLLTSINLEDDLKMGYSHFFAEVLRVKKMAEFIGENKRFFFVVDELFKGTNVKDAYEATVALTSAFSKKQNCMFVVSTHIIEAGETLMKNHKNIRFIYLPTFMEDGMPVYPYTIQTGITSDRHGMVIINNEGILDILKEGEKDLIDMSAEFITDNQTLNDLNILGKYKPGSVFSLFNHLDTKGGERLLEKMFKDPLVDYESINKRSSSFSYFHDRDLRLPFNTEEFEVVERFLLSGGARSLMRVGLNTIRRFLLRRLGVPQEHEIFYYGFRTSLKLLKRFYKFLDELFQEKEKNPLFNEIANLHRQFFSNEMKKIIEIDENKQISLFRLIIIDYQLRDKLRKVLTDMFSLIYQLDIFISVSRVAKRSGFSYARALPQSKSSIFSANGLFHPSLKYVVPNDIELSSQKNMVFLTGANMAGKSTLMKSVGIAFFLAHLGFPVPAKKMSFSVQKGFYSSINLSDNIDMGYSHYYSEVMRVKHVAEQVSSGKSLFILFDELFKGTNVKDAYDATLAVTNAFSKFQNCFFIISTHIIEVGHDLGMSSDRIQYKYLPTVMENNVPQYTYKLKDGITDDRQGMVIIRNEKILEIIENSEERKIKT